MNDYTYNCNKGVFLDELFVNEGAATFDFFRKVFRLLLLPIFIFLQTSINNKIYSRVKIQMMLVNKMSFPDHL